MPGKEKINFLLLLIILLTTGLLSYLSLNKGHDWGDDFALYIRQAQSIIEGTELQCLQDNIFAMDKSSGPSGPHIYPWGFPLILAPIYALFGLNLLAFKITGIAFFLLSLLLMFFLFKSRSSSNAIIVAAIIGFNPFFIAFNDNILSDFPFLFFCFLSLFLIFEVILSSKNSFRNSLWHLLLGFVIFYSFYLRPNGIVLILVLIITQIIEYVKNIKLSSLRFSIKPFLPHIVFLLFYLISKLYFPQAKESHLAFLQKINFEQILFNFEYYFIELPKVFFGNFESFNIALILFPFALIGGGQTLKKEYPLHLFFTGTLAIFLIWPDTQGLRYIFPLLPLFLYFSFSGISFVNQKIRVCSKFNWISKVVGLLLIFWFLTKSVPAIIEKDFSSGKVMEGPFESESIEAFKFLKNNSTKEDIIIFFKPRALNLLISRKSALIYDFERIGSLEGSYLMIHKFMGGYNQIKPDDKRLQSTYWLQLVFENNHYFIYKIK